METKIESGAMFALPVRIKPKAGKGRHLRKESPKVSLEEKERSLVSHHHTGAVRSGSLSALAGSERLVEKLSLTRVTTVSHLRLLRSENPASRLILQLKSRSLLKGLVGR